MSRRWLVLFTVSALILSASSVGVGAPATPRTGRMFVPDEVLVKFGPDVNPAVFARSIGARVHGRIPALDVHVLKVPTGRVEAIVRSLSNHPLVEYIEPNGIATVVLDPNDPYDNTVPYDSTSGPIMQWAWATVQAYQAWDSTTGSSSVKVCVVDTGVDNSNPDLPTFLAGDQIDYVNNDTIAEDDHGHGTHVAGTIAALTNNGNGVAGAGANWNVRLLAAKVLNAEGSGSYAAVAQGITWCANQGAKAINISLGGYAGSRTLQKAVNYASNRGSVLACAAGNDGWWFRLYPAAYANCIAVAATDQTDSIAWFSNWDASWVDVAAPGVAILSTMPNSPVTMNTSWGYKQDYDALNGTSMATPHVTGLAGLVWAKGNACGNGSSTATCVRSKIETNADQISGTGSYWKYGRVNYFKSVQ